MEVVGYEQYSLLDKKKANAEYLTPQPLIDFIHADIGERWSDKRVIDVCCGSGGLIYALKCQSKYGVELNPDACAVARRNGLEVLEGDFFDFNWDEQRPFDCVISNPPYSLPKSDKALPVYAKWGQKSGVLDPFFVLESWTRANFEGYYVLFPGLLYREKEKWFRRYLIDNNYIDKVWMIAPNTFKDTSISVIVLKLKYNRDTTVVKTYAADGYENIVDIKSWVEDDYRISVEERPVEEEEIDINELNKQVAAEWARLCELHRRLDEAVKEVEDYLKRSENNE